jgi:hypothetical protein
MTVTIQFSEEQKENTLRQDVISREDQVMTSRTSTWTYRERSRYSSPHADPLRQQGPGRGRPPRPWLLRRGLGKADLREGKNVVRYRKV